MKGRNGIKKRVSLCLALFMVLSVCVGNMGYVFAEGEKEFAYQVVFKLSEQDVLQYDETKVVAMDEESVTLSYRTGEEVTFSIMEKEGYLLENISVLSADGKEVVYEVNDSSYAFLMPDSNVCAEVLFAENTEAEKEAEASKETAKEELDALIIDAETELDIVYEGEELQEEIGSGEIALMIAAKADVIEEVTSAAARTASSGTVTVTKGEAVYYPSAWGYYSTHYYAATIDGVTYPAYCLEPAEGSTVTGDYVYKVIHDSEEIQKVLYYGYGGPGQSEWLDKQDYSAAEVSEDQAKYVLTHVAASYYYFYYAGGSGDSIWTEALSGINQAGYDAMVAFVNYATAQEVPSVALSFSEDNVKASHDKDTGIQKTKTITFEASRKNTVTIPLQNGVTLHNVTQGTTNTGDAIINGGDQFYLTAPLDLAVTQDVEWNTGELSGSIAGEWRTLIIGTGEGYQAQGTGRYSYGSATAISLSVTWTAIGDIELYKVDSETNEAKTQGTASLKGAEYVVKNASGTTVETIKTDKEGYGTLKDLPFGTYIIQETVPSEGYLLDERIYKVTLPGNGGNPLVAAATSKEQVIRGDVTIAKYLEDSAREDTDIKNTVSGIEFIITSNTTGKEAARITTDEDGYASTYDGSGTGALVYDTYTVSENPGTVPEGYKGLKDFTVTISEDGQNAKYIIENNGIYGAVEVKKIAFDTFAVIADYESTFKIQEQVNGEWTDVEFVVSHYPKEVKQVELTTDETGSFVIPEKLDAGTYRIVETSAPEGYLPGCKNEAGEIVNDLEFTISENHDWDDPQVVEFADDVQMGQIRITKVDEETGKTVGEGFTFDIIAKEDIYTNDGTLRYEKDAVVGTLTTDETGIAASEELYLGSYSIAETTAGEYYALDDTVHEVTLAYDSEVTTVIADLKVENEKTNLNILKVDSLDEKILLEGVTFRVYSSKDIEKEKAVQIAESLAELVNEQEIEKEALLKNQGKELENLRTEQEAGFIQAQRELRTELEKTLEITNLNELGNEYVTDETGQIDISDLMHGTAYYIYESKTIDGYNLSGELYEVYVNENGLIDGESSYTLKVSNVPNQLEITKDDITNNKELPGAELELKNDNGDMVEEWVSTDEAHVITGLAAGTYTLTEITAPDGYAIAESITFAISDSLEVEQIVMHDEPLTEGKIDDKSESTISASNPKTGDQSNFPLALGVTAIAGIVGVSAGVNRHRIRKKSKK